jgi:hypothetical protein
MTLIGRLTAALVVATATMAMGAGPANACTFAATELRVTPTTVTAGETISVTGISFFVVNPTPPTTTTTIGTDPPIATCSDVVPGGPVLLRFVQGDRVVELGAAQPDDQLSLAATVTIPVDARPGAATLTASADYLDADVTVALTVRGTAPPVVAPDYTG